MPLRSWWIKKWPGAKQQLRRTLESPLWGVPGCINFIDARTKWLDDAVTSAIQGGITQVRHCMLTHTKGAAITVSRYRKLVVEVHIHACVVGHALSA